MVVRLKICFFRIGANKMRSVADQANGGPMPLGGTSCRDAFPKDKVNDAKALVEKSMGLKGVAREWPSEWCQRAGMHHCPGGQIQRTWWP